MQILCFFLFFFYLRAAVSVVFSTLLSCSGFIVYSFCIMYFLSKQIKMMMLYALCFGGCHLAVHFYLIYQAIF